MPRDVEIERRLQSWARWKAGLTAGGLGYATVDTSLIGVDRGGYRESTIPALGAEAVETDELVRQLESRLRRTVEVVYLQGGSMAKKARALVCAERTVYSRLDDAHAALRMLIAERHRARLAERKRVEALQRAAAGV